MFCKNLLHHSSIKRYYVIPNIYESLQKLESPNKNQQESNQQHKLNERSSQQVKRRPNPVMNQFPENQTVFKRLIPGPSMYSETVKLKRKLALLCDSIPKPISLYHMKKKLKDVNIYKKNASQGLIQTTSTTMS